MYNKEIPFAGRDLYYHVLDSCYQCPSSIEIKRWWLQKVDIQVACGHYFIMSRKWRLILQSNFSSRFQISRGLQIFKLTKTNCPLWTQRLSNDFLQAGQDVFREEFPKSDQLIVYLKSANKILQSKFTSRYSLS